MYEVLNIVVLVLGCLTQLYSVCQGEINLIHIAIIAGLLYQWQDPQIFTSRVSSRGHRIGAVCVCLSVSTLIAEQFDL